MDGSVLVAEILKDTTKTEKPKRETRPLVVEWCLDPENDSRFNASTSCGGGCGCGCA